MSFVLFLIGAGGIAGAIETGEGLIPAVIVLAVGIAGLLYEVMKYQEGGNHKKHRNYNFSNCHQYPSMLGEGRRA